MGAHAFIGAHECTYSELVQKWQRNKNACSLELFNAEKRRKASYYKNSGYIDVVGWKEERAFQLHEYLRGGLQMNLAIGIDFTGSNGNPADPRSLHHVNPGRPNTYETAIRAVGDVLAVYDADQKFPVFGFGATPRGEGALAVRHCFPINFNETDASIVSMEGVLSAYVACMHRISLAGPTFLAPLIRRACQMVRAVPCTQAEQNYLVLLILTDGDIMDMKETKAAIVDASHLPLSIVLVGLGGEDFALMKQLDSNDQLLSDASGRQCVDDIVHFVKFAGLETSALLAQEVLKELPGQVERHMRRHGIVPGDGHVLAAATAAQASAPELPLMVSTHPIHAHMAPATLSEACQYPPSFRLA